MESDAQLVENCLSGDQSAWEELLRRHSSRLYQLFYRFTGNRQETEDLTQDLFLRIYQTLRSYRPAEGSFKTWITSVGRNLLIDHYRRARHDRQTSSLDDETSGVSERPTKRPDPELVARQSELSGHVEQALLELRPELREAVILRDLQQLEYREIQHILGVPEGTVKSRINRGRIELARTLQRMGIGPE
ncbi:MAG: sigma-70 family RNA polymerase sigma factor [Acidobacteriota bacterium]|nr:sigma-70 family RNA polymerase sigma factor [Acidobacteriota bacterium]